MPAAAGGGASPGRADVDAAVAFRAKLGLPAGRAFVATTFGNRTYAKGRWGVPLDAAEAVEV
ncbi:MAG TPA: hypothetical protein VFM38_11785, partial [Candidatus Limnocylindrales bacterium]|nr:hypothetical protein [Candidatus Limnocylindrales bacterium]